MLNATDTEAENRITRKLLNLLIRAALVMGLAWKCYAIFAPFLSLMLWSLILAVNMFPLHQRLARKLGGRQGLASCVLAMAGVALFVIPTGFLMNTLGDNISGLIEGVRTNSIKIPNPPATVADWPVIGKKIYPAWQQAATDLPALVQSLQPKIGDVARDALGMVASFGGALLQFFASYLIAGVIMVHGQSGHTTARAISLRIVGEGRGEHFVTLCTSTVRAVARGVIGVAFTQALLLGIALTIAQVPAAGLLSLLALVLGIAQAPAAVITLPAIVYIWAAGGHSTALAIAYSVLLLVVGSLDNFLKPMLLGRGVEAPMPVVLLGALGGMVTTGILGLFVGSTTLTLGYRLFMDWVAGQAPQEAPAPVASDDGPEGGGD